MTLANAPWALDGARTNAARARLAEYAATGGQGGIIKASDLRVTALSPNGNGLRILKGGGIVLNRYLADPDEVYVISNPNGVHTVGSESMPPASGSAASYLVCIVVGDPEFNQTGHPFMPADLDPDPAVRRNFNYVRPVLIPCPAGTTRFSELNRSYPGIELARIDVPPNTTTITDAMITDLRKLAQPKSEHHLLTGMLTNGIRLEDSWKDLTDYQPVVRVPDWATHIVATSQVVSALVWQGTKADGVTRLYAGSIMSADMGYDYNMPSPGDGIRVNIVNSIASSVVAQRGQDLKLRVHGLRTIGPGYIETWGTSVIYDVRFYERPI